MKIEDVRSHKNPAQSAQNHRQDSNQRVTRSQGKVLPSTYPLKNSINKSALESSKKPESAQNLPGTSKAQGNAVESEPAGRGGISVVSPRNLMPSKVNKMVIEGKSEDAVKVSQKGNVSVIDIDVPCSNKVAHNLNQPRKRRNSREDVNWNTVFSTLSKNDASFMKRRCLMEEVEISLGNSLGSPHSPLGNSLEPPPLSIIPLDRRKSAHNLDNNSSKCPIMIKDEIDIPPEMEFESLDVQIIE